VGSAEVCGRGGDRGAVGEGSRALGVPGVLLGRPAASDVANPHCATSKGGRHGRVGGAAAAGWRAGGSEPSGGHEVERRHRVLRIPAPPVWPQIRGLQIVSACKPIMMIRQAQVDSRTAVRIPLMRRFRLAVYQTLRLGG
jgi:hypothetical protein